MTEKISLDELLSKRGGGDSVRKAFKAPPSWNPEARSARFIMSSETVDRQGDIIVQAGLDTARFMENPQGLLFHQSREFPIGLWSDVKVVNGRPRRTEGTLTLMAEGVEPLADRAAAHIAAGTFRAVSIGFIPRDYEMIRDEEDRWTGGLKFTESELIECSLVPVPAQPDALVKAVVGDPALVREELVRAIDEWHADLAALGLSKEAFVEALREYELGGTIILPALPKLLPEDISEMIDGAIKSAFEARDVRWNSAGPLTLTKSDDDVLVEGKWPGFLQMAKSLLAESSEKLTVEGDQITFACKNVTLVYRKIAERTDAVLCELVSAEPHEVAPALIPGSAALARAKIAATRARAKARATA